MMAGNATSHFDIAYVADRATLVYCAEWIANEIAINAVAGYTTAVVPIPDAGSSDNSLSESIAWCSHQRWAEVIDPTCNRLSATLGVFPSPLYHAPGKEFEAVTLQVYCALLVVDGPLHDTEGEVRPEIQKLAAWIESIGPGHTEWATTSKHTQTELEQSPYVTLPSRECWEPVFYPNYWTRKNDRPTGDTPVLGRHAIPLADWWPQTLNEYLKFYPTSGHARVTLLGAQAHTLKMLGGRPRHWTFFSYGSIAVRRFLQRIDFFVECKSPGQMPLIKANVLGAMAMGVVPVLRAGSASDFEDVGLTYDEPEDVMENVLALSRIKESHRTQAERCRQFVLDNYGPSVHVDRLHRLIGARKLKMALPAPFAPAASSARTEPSSVLFVTSNGIGVGHVSRMMAIAKRLPPRLSPVFVTMSSALSILRKEGFHAEYIPFHEYAKCDLLQWNRWLYAELLRLIRIFGAKVVLFDGHFPYTGLCNALSRDPDVFSVWCRRAMWNRAVWDESLERTKFFDVVIEPGELAAEMDIGATVPHRDTVQAVEPITFLNEADLLSSADAREALRLNEQRTNVLLQLSSGNHINIVPVIEEILATFSRIGDFQVTIAEWPNADYTLDQWSGVGHLATYPHAKYYRGFDFVISACGYNSFHELIQYGIPTVFMPIELSFLDNQLARAKFAAKHSLGLCLRFNELSRLEETIRQMMDRNLRARISERCLAKQSVNGAATAADIIAKLLA